VLVVGSGGGGGGGGGEKNAGKENSPDRDIKRV